jgi:PAS domain S-box-containing protein
VLVATSDSATRALLRKALHVRAVEIVEAADGVEALALARRLGLDLVLLDAFLAVLDGISVCSRIRALEGVDQPLIAIMGLSSQRTIELAYAEGADEIIPKPLQPALIRQRVEILLKRKQKEKRLELLERAFEVSGSGITILDALSSEYPVSYANPAFLEMCGYAREEIEGRNLRLLRGPETDVAAQTELRDAFNHGRAARVLLQNYRKDGSTFWNDLSASPIRDRSGRVTHYVAVQTDVTQRIKSGKLAAGDLEQFAAERTRELKAVLGRIEERRRFVESILNGLIAGLMTADAKGVVSFANRSALRTLGVSLADCVGRPVLELFGNNDELREAIQGAADRPETRLDFPLITPGGVRLYVGMSVLRVPVELRAELGFVVLFRDLAETLERSANTALSHESAATVAEAAAVAEARRQALASNPDAAFAAADGEPVDLDAEEDAGSNRRRARLALRYCSPRDLVEQAIHNVVPGARPGNGVAVDGPKGLPDVLVDRDQVVEALGHLLANAAHRAGGVERVRIRLGEASAIGERGLRSEPFVRVDVLFPREQITDEDLGADAAGHRREHRREDLATAEQLLQANGGRLDTTPTAPNERCLSALIPSSGRGPSDTDPAIGSGPASD